MSVLHKVQGHYVVKPCRLCHRDVIVCPNKSGQYIRVEYKGIKYNEAEDVFTGREHICLALEKELDRHEKQKSTHIVRNRNGRFPKRAGEGDDSGRRAG